MGSICWVKVQMSILRRRMATLRCTWQHLLDWSNSCKYYRTTTRIHMHATTGTKQRRRQTLMTDKRFQNFGVWFQVRRGRMAVRLLHCMLSGPCMLLLDVQGGESVASWCHDTLSCYLTLPTKNNRILRVNTLSIAESMCKRE